ncbi:MULTISPECIES: hypothetical protein [Streptomyces]|uniref:hypothetical protein n=1 Tax=Streptomyces TaxID=1883 RepID=UPI0004CBAB85
MDVRSRNHVEVTGRTDGPLDGHVADALETIGEPAPGPVAFGGHSVSAMTAVPAAAREPEAFAGTAP